MSLLKVCTQTHPTCPCCSAPVSQHPENGCVLYTLIQVLGQRGALTASELAQVHADCDVDTLWSDIGPVLDKLEVGHYSNSVAESST